MRFLIDNALSPRLATELTVAGHDAIHVTHHDMGMAEDGIIFDYAATENRIIVTADTDFGTLLALRKTNKPSVIIFRFPQLRYAAELATVIIENLSQLTEDLLLGAVVIIQKDVIRIRRLPIGGPPYQ